nr:hypothetical protein [Anaerolineaceae bacterium]
MANDLLPTTIIIFGASGDLTKRKLIPALFNLCRKGRLPGNLNIVGFSSSAFTNETFRKRMSESIQGLELEAGIQDECEKYLSKIHYFVGNYKKLEDYQGLNKFLKNLEGEKSNRIYYLATPPVLFLEIVNKLGTAGMLIEEDYETNKQKESLWRRVVI